MTEQSHGAADWRPQSPTGSNKASCLFEIASPGLPTFSLPAGSNAQGLFAWLASRVSGLHWPPRNVACIYTCLASLA